MNRRERVWMAHPDLLDRDPTPVLRCQVPHLGAAGWYEVDPPAPPEPKPKPAEKKPKGAASPSASSKESE